MTNELMVCPFCGSRKLLEESLKEVNPPRAKDRSPIDNLLAWLGSHKNLRIFRNLVPNTPGEDDWSLLTPLFLSYIFPGLGHLYLKPVLKNLLFLIVAVIFISLEYLYYYSHFVDLLNISCGFFLAYTYFSVFRETLASAGNKISPIGYPLFVCMTVAVIFLQMYFLAGIFSGNTTAVRIYAAYFAPEFEPGDTIVLRGNLPRGGLKIGDIVVTQYYDEIERVYALEGDKMEVSGNYLLVNGKVPFADPKIIPITNSNRKVSVSGEPEKSQGKNLDTGVQQGFIVEKDCVGLLINSNPTAVKISSLRGKVDAIAWPPPRRKNY
ncbi:MAG: hypothetical protein HQM08_07145 [Candidatus Riflebacteria bacterium]|nr:hypothetical protein [Candidatus Riflebacteria bacterium]